jgi:hypothetical protein
MQEWILSGTEEDVRKLRKLGFKIRKPKKITL